MTSAGILRSSWWGQMVSPSCAGTTEPPSAQSRWTSWTICGSVAAKTGLLKTGRSNHCPQGVEKGYCSGKGLPHPTTLTRLYCLSKTPLYNMLLSDIRMPMHTDVFSGVVCLGVHEIRDKCRHPPPYPRSLLY